MSPQDEKNLELIRKVEEHRRMKREYGALLEEMCEILYRIDPEGIGATAENPHHDEYSIEVAPILARMLHAESSGQLRRIVQEEFARYFGKCRVSDDLLDQAIQEIWAAYQRFTSLHPRDESAGDR